MDASQVVLVVQKALANAVDEKDMGYPWVRILLNMPLFVWDT